LIRKIVARSSAEMDRLRPVWTELERSGSHTLFQSFAWNRLAANIFAAREEPYVVCMHTDSGAAIIPAAIVDFGVTLLGEALFDYRDVLHVGDPELLRLAWQEIAALKLPLFFTALRGEQCSLTWHEFKPEKFVGAPCVQLADMDADRFASAHSRLGSRFRRLLRKGVELQQQAAPSSDLIHHIYQLKAAQTPNNLFRDPARVKFMTAVMEAACECCELYTLNWGGEIVAALVTFRDGDTRRFYGTYYDHEWAHFSPGIVLLFEATRRSLAEGLNCDYMTGEQSHKTRLATGSVPLFRIESSWENLARISGFEEHELLAA